jgi:hypothetical protein
LLAEFTYYVKHETIGKRCYTENAICMLEFLTDNISVASQ